MAVPTLSNRHLLRDLPHASLVLVYAAVVLGLLVFASYRWSVIQAGKPLPQSTSAGDAMRYSGSIMLEPPRGDWCWQRVFDNRTGAVWDKGYVKCDPAPAPAPGDQPKGMDAKRLLEVGKAFRHAD